jgi:protein TonB
MKIEAAAPRAGNPNPEYPASARRHGVEGREALLVDIRADGTVAGVEIAESSSHDALDAAAALAVRRWLFRPARRDGDAIDWRARIPVVFRLLD